jgi:UDP-N-acetylmuramoyl-tripeptide--D-alanyl-D-alanine ligase
VIGVTGSNGKTTLKELIAVCLAQQAPTLATHGNLNNDIGMPLMLARIDDSHHFAVLEMGANHAGEIAYLTSLANPDVVVITNAAAAHLEGFGSIDGVAAAKGEILQNEKRPRVTADVRADDIVASASCTEFTLHLAGESVAVTLPLVGVHNVRNACAAAAVAYALGISVGKIRSALDGVSPVGGRLEPVRGMHGATLFDDSYNANPLSVVAAAEFLSALPGESWLVLGDMKELGDDAAKMHREVGEAVRTSGVNRLFAFGDLARSAVEGFGENARWYASLHMERVVDALREPDAVRREA